MFAGGAAAEDPRGEEQGRVTESVTTEELS